MTDSTHEKIQKKHELEQHEVKQVVDFLTRYGKLIAAGVIAATVAVLVSRGLAASKAAKMAEAEQMLMTVQNPQQLEDLVNDYKSTPTAPVALLDLAKRLFNEGQFTQAREQYGRFVKDYKRSDLLPIAEFGLAHCTEADGNFEAAISELKDFLSAHPGHYLESPAILAIARCLEQAGQTEEARITLEDFLAEHAGSHWSGAAEASLQQLGN
jgi:TolA-binding protein